MSIVATYSYRATTSNLIGPCVSSQSWNYISPEFSNPDDSQISFQVTISPSRSVYLQFGKNANLEKNDKYQNLKITFQFTVETANNLGYIGKHPINLTTESNLHIFNQIIICVNLKILNCSFI